MSSTIATALHSKAAAESSSRSLTLPFVVGSVLAMAGALGYIATNGLEPREAYLHALTIPASIAAVAGCLILAVSMARWRVGVPAWATLGAAIGLGLAAASAYESVSAFRAVAEGTDNATFRDLTFENSTILAPLFVKSAILAVCLGVIGIVGMRRKEFSRIAGAFFVLAAIVSLFPVAMPGLVVLSIALLLTARGANATA